MQKSDTAIALDETLAMIGMTELNDEKLQLMTVGMDALVRVLGNVVIRLGQERH